MGFRLSQQVFIRHRLSVSLTPVSSFFNGGSFFCLLNEEMFSHASNIFWLIVIENFGLESDSHYVS